MRIYFLYLLFSLGVAIVGGAVAYIDHPKLVTCVAAKVLTGGDEQSCDVAEEP
jgi:hypothetical protein